MRKLLLLILLSASTFCHAQISTYSFASSAGTFTEISGGTLVPALATGAGISDALPIGFSFVFNGVAYSKVVVASDGYLSFNPSATVVPLNNLAAGPANIRPLLAPLWDDLGGAVGYSTFSYLTAGAAGSRVFTAQWRWFAWSYTNAITISFQVKLYEGTNKIEYLYRPEFYPPANASASIGIAAGGTGSGNFLALSNLIASPIVSSTINFDSVKAKPDTIRVYSFTPPPPPATDLAVSEVSIPTSICPTTSLPVSVTIYNGGANPINFSSSPTTVSVNVAGPNTQSLSATLSSGSLAAGATQVVSLPSGINVSASGAYTFRSSVALTGDSNNGNDTLTTTATIANAASPWAERFATTALPNGWKNSGWAISQNAGNSSIKGNPGNFIYKRIGADTAGAFTILPVGPIAATDKLSFDYKLFNSASPYNLPAAGWGHFKVQISTDCGTTFTTIDTVASATATLGWDFKAYPLAAYAGQYVTVRILPKWYLGDYYMGFDNFKIKTPSPIDIALGGMNTTTGTCPGASQPVTVTVRNDGSNPIDFSANNTLITVKSTGALTQTISTTINSGTLAAGATRVVPLSSNLNLSAAGTYNFEVYQSTTGDGDRSNDTTTSNTYVSRYTATPPWSEPFATTTTPTGWSIGGWNIFTYGGANGNPGYNIFKSYSTIGTLGEFYTIAVGPLDSNSVLRFDHKVSAAASPYGPPVPDWGFFKVQVTPNCDNVYTTIDSVTTADNGWISKSYSLAAYAGQVVAFRMQAICSKPNYVVAFDNFQVISAATTDLAALSLTAPAGQCPNPAAPLTFTIKNTGTTTIDFAANPATVVLNTTGAAMQTVTSSIATGTLAPQATRNIALSANLTAAGSYGLKANINLSGDGYAANDTASATATIVTATTTTAPWAEPFTTANIPTGWTAPAWTVGQIRGVYGNTGNNIYQTLDRYNPTSTIRTLAVGPLPANSSMGFDYKVAYTTSPYYPAIYSFGNIVVQINVDCGGSFINLDTIYTADAGWRTQVYSLAAYAGKMVSIRLIATGVVEPLDFAFDNFRIATLPPPDLQNQFFNIGTGDCPADSAEIQLAFKNAGAGTWNFERNNVTVTAQITGPIPQTLTKIINNGSLAPGASYNLFFPAKASLATAGTYSFKGFTSATADTIRSNDTLIFSRTNGSTVPWIEPFADTILPPVINSFFWHVGAVRGATGNPGYNLYYNLRSDTFQPFYTKGIGLINANNYLRFDYKISNTTPPYNPPASGWGYFKVQISTNCASTYTTIDSIATATTGWATKTYSLAAYAGKIINIQITPQWKAGNYDMAFDNFQVSDLAPCPAPNSGYTDQRTDSSARVNFTGTGSNFLIEYGPYGFTPGTGATAGPGGVVVVATGSPLTVAGLSALTGYKFYVRQNCTNAGTGFSTNRLIDSFVTAIAPQLPMTNDLPANAIVLTVGAGCSGARYTINGATQSSGEPAVSCSGSLIGGKVVWFKFAAPANGFVKVSTDAAGNTLNDTKAALFSVVDSSNFSTFQILACDDDNGVIRDQASIFYATGLVPGRNYYVAVDGFNASDTGRFCIQVSAADSSMVAASGSCFGGQQLPEHLPTYRGWLSAIDYSGKLIANIRSNTTLPGNVTYYSFVNVNTDSVRQAATGEYYLDRNFSINHNFPATAGNWDIQLFFLNKELRALQTVAPTTTLLNLNVTRGKDSLCRNTFLSGSADSLLVQSASGTASGISWVTVPTSRLANFYLNPGTSPLPRLYVFTGSGNWSNPANWSDNIVPPAILPANCVIEIKPAPGGQCILDVNQRITSGDRLRIRSGTNLVIPGSVIIQ